MGMFQDEHPPIEESADTIFAHHGGIFFSAPRSISFMWSFFLGHVRIHSSIDDGKKISNSILPIKDLDFVLEFKESHKIPPILPGEFPILASEIDIAFTEKTYLTVSLEDEYARIGWFSDSNHVQIIGDGFVLYVNADRIFRMSFKEDDKREQAAVQAPVQEVVQLLDEKPAVKEVKEKPATTADTIEKHKNAADRQRKILKVDQPSNHEIFRYRINKEE